MSISGLALVGWDEMSSLHSAHSWQNCPPTEETRGSPPGQGGSLDPQRPTVFILTVPLEVGGPLSQFTQD